MGTHCRAASLQRSAGGGEKQFSPPNSRLTDANGRVRKITDPNGLITRLTYDGRGRLKTSDAGGELTTYSYDGVGNLERLTLPDGSYLQYGYDDAQRLASITDSLGNKVTYTLDDLGNRKKEDTTDPSGTLAQTLARGFDTLGRLREQLGSTATQQTLYTYDSQGNVKSIRDPLQHVTVNDYDELNRLKKVTEPQLAGEAAAGTIQYTYDPQDNLSQWGQVLQYSILPVMLLPCPGTFGLNSQDGLCFSELPRILRPS